MPQHGDAYMLFTTLCFDQTVETVGIYVALNMSSHTAHCCDGGLQGCRCTCIEQANAIEVVRILFGIWGRGRFHDHHISGIFSFAAWTPGTDKLMKSFSECACNLSTSRPLGRHDGKHQNNLSGTQSTESMCVCCMPACL